MPRARRQVVLEDPAGSVTPDMAHTKLGKQPHRRCLPRFKILNPRGRGKIIEKEGHRTAEFKFQPILKFYKELQLR